MVENGNGKSRNGKFDAKSTAHAKAREPREKRTCLRVNAPKRDPFEDYFHTRGARAWVGSEHTALRERVKFLSAEKEKNTVSEVKRFWRKANPNTAGSFVFGHFESGDSAGESILLISWLVVVVVVVVVVVLAALST